MEDIAPGLLLRIRSSFQKRMEESKEIQTLYQKIQSGGATYADAEDYAYQIGQALSQAFGENLGSAVLPDGRMYYNIADRILRPLLEEDYSIVAKAAQMVQQALNQQAGIGITAQTAAVNLDRIQGIVDKVSNAEVFDDVAWVLDEPVKNFSMNVVDETIRKNVNFQGRSGLRPKVIRKSERKCCSWCSNLAGEYEYPDVPEDVYRRHENCRCTVEYDPGSGRRQNVHTKKWTTDGQRDMIEERKQIGLANTDIFRPKNFHSTIGAYVNLNPSELLEGAKAGKRHSHAGVYRDAVTKSKKQLQKSIISRTAQVERHADKIRNPENYVPDWREKSIGYREGLIRKWEKDMRRNAEQAEIELAVFEEMYGL